MDVSPPPADLRAAPPPDRRRPLDQFYHSINPLLSVQFYWHVAKAPEYTLSKYSDKIKELILNINTTLGMIILNIYTVYLLCVCLWLFCYEAL